MNKETYETRLLVKINNLFEKKEELILKDSDATDTIDKSEVKKNPPIPQNERKHVEYVKDIKENIILKDLPSKPKTQLSSTKTDKNFNRIKKPIIHRQEFKGDNIGHHPLPGLIPLQNISSNQCFICGTSVNNHIREYCLNNQHKFKGNVYCHKHLKE